MKNFKTTLKEKFAYDVSDIASPAYIDSQSEDIYTDLLYTSGLTSRINVLENVKGKQTIKLLNANLALQEATCATLTNADGTITFEGKDIETKRLMVLTELCNDTLTDTWAQLLLAIGANRQDRDMPLEDVLIAYMIKQSKSKNQDLMFKGDTASATPDLAHYDGFLKLWEASNSGVTQVTTTETAIDATNGFDLAKKVYDAIPSVLFDNGANVEIITGRAEANAILSQIYNDKDYASSIQVEEDGSSMSFVLPTTSTRVRTYPQLNGLGKMIAVPYDYMFYGCDLDSDSEGMEIKYLEESEKLRARNLFRSGVQFVYPEYFVRLILA